MTVDVYQATLMRASLAVFLAMSGGMAATMKRLTHQQLCTLISYAAGMLLMVTFLDMLPFAYRHVGLVATFTGCATGYALFALVSRYVAHVCPACAASHTETVFRQVTWVMVVALSVHCVMDSVALAASGGHLAGQEGFALATAVFVHKVPEGLALTGIAVGAGWSRRRALGLTFAVEALTTILGVWLGVATGVHDSPAWMGWVMAHVGGGFLFLAGHALINELARHRPRATAIAAVLGMCTLWAAHWLYGGTHTH